MRKLREEDGPAKKRQLKASQKSSLRRLLSSKKSSLARVEHDPNNGDNSRGGIWSVRPSMSQMRVQGRTHKTRPLIIKFCSFVIHRKSAEGPNLVTVSGISVSLLFFSAAFRPNIQFREEQNMAEYSVSDERGNINLIWVNRCEDIFPVQR